MIVMVQGPGSLLDAGIRGHVSGGGRVLALTLGAALLLWGAAMARRRSVLIPTLTLLLAIGAGVIAFAAYPAGFDRLSYMMGIAYPPMLYFLLSVSALTVVVLHLAARLSSTDERCRRLTQEIALLKTEQDRRWMHGIR
jgi:hypothetical protein